jgi:hypothetical protein
VPAAFLVLLLVTYEIGSGILKARDLESPALDFLLRVGLLWSVVWWLKADSRRRGVRQVYCLGLLATVGWFILLPYHLLRTRGAAGLLVILLFVAIVIGGGFLGVVTYVMFGGQID